MVLFTVFFWRSAVLRLSGGAFGGNSVIPGSLDLIPD
jgi:hypothetical protein